MVGSHIRGEYVSLFLNLCAKLGINHKFIALDTQTIELLKEKNGALEDMVNAMFVSRGLSHGMTRLWNKEVLRSLEIYFLVNEEVGRSSGINDEVVQDQRQRDDNDLQDERQDQPKEEEVEPRRSKGQELRNRLDPILFLLWTRLWNKEVLRSLEIYFLVNEEVGRSSGINDEVVQDQRQRDDNDLQDERQDQPKEEEVEPRRSKGQELRNRLDPILFLLW
nr:hypothetical protein [Tanacetum cinerariifolium]